MSSEAVPDFWDRQFAPNATWPQVEFDLAVGVALPLICLAADPFVFQGGITGSPLLGAYRLFAYTFIGSAVIALICWLSLRAMPAFLAGVFFADALFALAIGAILLPWSMIGLAACIGVLGFAPFFTSLAYARNACRAWAEAGRRSSTPLVLVTIGFLTASAGPYLLHSLVNWEIGSATELSMSADDSEANRGITRLRRIEFVANWDTLVGIYHAEKDDGRRERLAKSYKELTGKDIEDRLGQLD